MTLHTDPYPMPLWAFITVFRYTTSLVKSGLPEQQVAKHERGYNIQ